MSKIKQIFVSRYGDDGIIADVDFSQLEIIGLAIVSGDIQLKKDLQEGLDMHCVSASLITGETYDHIKEQYDSGNSHYIALRKEAKVPSFQLTYGAGAKRIAETLDWPVQKAKDYIDNYYQRYEGVWHWQQDISREVNNNLIKTSDHWPDGTPKVIGFYRSLTGRIYVFNQFENPWKKGTYSFSPTQMKNYPVQGFSTGDIVPEILGRIFRELVQTEEFHNIKIINTVHDSYIFDMKKMDKPYFEAMLKNTIGKTSIYMKQRFGIDIDVPINYDINYGRNWYKCK